MSLPCMTPSGESTENLCKMSFSMHTSHAHRCQVFRSLCTQAPSHCHASAIQSFSTAWVPFVCAHTSIGSTAPAFPRTPHSKVRKACAALTQQASNHMVLLVVLAAASAQHSHVIHRCGQVGVDGGELDLRAREQHKHRFMKWDGCVLPLQATSISVYQPLEAF